MNHAIVWRASCSLMGTALVLAYAINQQVTWLAIICALIGLKDVAILLMQFTSKLIERVLR